MSEINEYQIEQPLTHEIKDYLNHFQKSVSGVEEENTAINFASFYKMAAKPSGVSTTLTSSGGI